MMDYIKDLYNRLFGDFLHLNFDSEFDLNYTCNVFLTKNMTLIEIDRGWEGIPESLVIQLILCLFLILPFVIFRYLARYQPYDMENRKHKNWIQFIYGNRDIKKRTLIYLDKSFQSIEAYFKNKNILPNILPYHLIMCRNLKQRKLNQSSSNQSSKQPVSSHRRTHSTLYGSASSTKVDATPLKISSSAMNLQNNDHNQDNHNQLSTTSSTSTATSTAVVAAPSTSTSSNVPTITTSSYDDANKPNDAETNDEIFVLNSPSSSTSSAITTSTTDGSNVSVLNLVINDNNCSHNGENSQIKHQSQTTFPSDMNSPTVQTFLHPLRDVGDGKRSPSGDPMNYIQLLFTRLLNITDEDILKNKGHDAYQYLLFQRYIIIFLFILTIVTIVIILPINVQGNNEGKAFARTSISNVSHESSVYWAHAICSTFIIAVGVFLMNRFASELKTDDDLMYCKTLLIRHIPLIENLNEKILNYFREKFPEIEITGIQLIADLRQLDALEQSYRNAMNAHEYCNDLNNESRNRHLQTIDDNSSGNHHQDNVTIMVENGNDDYNDDNRFMIRPINCNRLCRCCCFQCCSAKIDAEKFYANEQQQLKEEIYQELISITNQSIRSAFITFRSESMAMRVYKYIKKEQKHSCQNCFLCNMCMNIIDYCYNDNARNEFDLTKCLVSHAPYPDDVNWRDIAFDMNLLWLRKMIISFILFIIFFFLSTPAFLLKIFDIIATKELIKNGILKPNSIITDFMSPFLLMLLAVILPSIVTYACQMTPYKTISDLNHAVMSKVFAFLVMMIIVLPSTGFLSINAMLGAIFASNGDQNRFRWHCLFPVDNGAFFVIYTLQATILGNVAEILRIPELVLYIVYSLFLRSKAEYKKARKWVTFDFPFGVSYARFLLIFTMTVIYSFACPLIAPCGLAYMFGKHLVDRYNIYHVYQPTKINRHIHSSAIMYVHIALVLMQFQLFTVMIVKTQYSHITLYVLIILILTLLESTFFGFHNWFRNLIKSPINRSKHTPKRDFCICSYTPPVLYHLLDDGIFQQQQQQQQPQPTSAKTAD